MHWSLFYWRKKPKQSVIAPASIKTGLVETGRFFLLVILPDLLRTILN